MLWMEWLKVVWELRGAFSRRQTFLWFVTCLIGMTIRKDLLGVTSIIRAIGLDSKYYDRILDFFHSSAVNLNKMTKLWVKIVLEHFPCIEYNNRKVIIGDGLKVGKSGKKMPGVKRLHQSSESNTKPEYITGHSFQVLGILCGGLAGYFSVPLISRIHEGLRFDKNDNTTLLDKMVLLLKELSIKTPCYLVVDAYYASGKMVKDLLGMGWHIVTRVRSNAVAYYPPRGDEQPKGRGRKKTYGEKIHLNTLFSKTNQMKSAKSPLPGDKNVTISYLDINLIWRPLGQIVRFVLVRHPIKGMIILMSTDLSLTALQIIEIYGYRFKIEVSFKHILRIIGAYCYHFWMLTMKKRSINDGDIHLYKETKKYQEQIKRKVNAYHIFVQIGIIAQGMMMYLSLSFPNVIWNSFGSWLRTMNTDIYPSEFVTSYALRNTFFEFLFDNHNEHIIKKFIRPKINIIRQTFLKLAS